MTTSKPYHEHDSPVSFHRPTVGVRVYIAKSSVGWAETYNREQADKALAALVAPISVEELLEQFQTMMELEGRPEHWGDVLSFLAEIINQDEDDIPEIAGVAFWGQLIVAERQKGVN